MRIFSKADVCIIVFSLIIILVTVLWDVNYLDYKRPISYADYKLIDLKDFKGMKRPFDNMDGEKSFGYIVTSIELFKHAEYLDVVALFHPSRSYMYKKNLRMGKGVLTHELYHFHITEYCARLFREQVTIKKASINDSILSQIEENIQQTENQLQSEYDDQTYHSYVNSAQIMWQMKVDSLLKTMEAYKNTKIFIKQNEKK
jgi:hypothetical protein